MEKIFIYGTLLRGQVNHSEMDGARLVGVASLSGYELWVDDYPHIVRGTGVVAGELYEVSRVLLARLDQFEDVPHLYQRVQVEVDSGINAWCYTRNAGRGHKVVNGSYQSYTDARHDAEGELHA